jgi:hypothetical protein
MVGINQKYAAEMKERFGYYGTWPPTLGIKIGDVGVIKSEVFQRESSLSDLGIRCEVAPDPNSIDYLEYASSDAVELQSKSGGIAAGATDLSASVSIRFTRADAVVFQASECRSASTSDFRSVADQILYKYVNDDWPDDYVVVTDLITTKSTTILISSGQNAHVELAMKAGLRLADADANVAVTRASAIGTQIIASKGLTPLFNVAGIRHRMFGVAHVARKSIGDFEFRRFAELKLN